MWNLRFKIQSYVSRKNLKLYFLYNLTSYDEAPALSFSPHFLRLKAAVCLFSLYSIFYMLRAGGFFLFVFVFKAVQGQKEHRFNNASICVQSARYQFQTNPKLLNYKYTSSIYVITVSWWYNWHAFLEMILRRLLENVVGCVDLVA